MGVMQALHNMFIQAGKVAHKMPLVGATCCRLWSLPGAALYASVGQVRTCVSDACGIHGTIGGGGLRAISRSETNLHQIARYSMNADARISIAKGESEL